jgi:hypothetical protein
LVTAASIDAIVIARGTGHTKKSTFSSIYLMSQQMQLELEKTVTIP